MTTPGIVTSVLRTRATCVVSIRGELDWQSSPDFDHSVANLASWRPALLAVDLRCLEYIDSVGVESLAVLRDEIARQGVARSSRTCRRSPDAGFNWPGWRTTSRSTCLRGLSRCAASSEQWVTEPMVVHALAAHEPA